jgi:hypothetical protein
MGTPPHSQLAARLRPARACAPSARAFRPPRRGRGVLQRRCRLRRVPIGQFLLKLQREHDERIRFAAVEARLDLPPHKLLQLRCSELLQLVELQGPLVKASPHKQGESCRTRLLNTKLDRFGGRPRRPIHGVFNAEIAIQRQRISHLCDWWTERFGRTGTRSRRIRDDFSTSRVESSPLISTLATLHRRLS